MDTANRNLAKILIDRSFLTGDFLLASGRRSQFYFDCRQTTCFAEAMPLIGEAFVREFTRTGVAPRSVGGLTSGADAIANAVSYFSLSQGSSINLFSIRKDRKEHGTERWIEGCGESPVAVVDDVATSGGSIIKAIERCIEEGKEIAYVGVLVDREEGGMDAIRKVVPNLPVTAVFTKSELDALRAQESGQS